MNLIFNLRFIFLVLGVICITFGAGIAVFAQGFAVAWAPIIVGLVALLLRASLGNPTFYTYFVNYLEVVREGKVILTLILVIGSGISLYKHSFTAIGVCLLIAIVLSVGTFLIEKS